MVPTEEAAVFQPARVILQMRGRITINRSQPLLFKEIKN